MKNIEVGKLIKYNRERRGIMQKELAKLIYADVRYLGRMGVFKHIIITNWAQVYTNSFYVETNTVGQYTGLIDKNGVEIYEGGYFKNSN